MYSVTWIESGRVWSISSPSFATACRTFVNVRIRARHAARLWHAAKGQTKMIF